ncbi:NAD(P)H-quinone oxidoreductase subunit 3 [Helicobacter pylori]|uniref:NAD(P)H-quinone oxidoreductase subunit 3 n=1 Tax=Helicobacter pylori TaxID=210 RepID=UPI000C3190E7|nr:NAD(P)H-quinone oxidoreductase subunit 3 [Helicobacter pylori]WRE51311.1 NAD(P)H-quinone oxidoreductase subunit 3 [Helicobacter pylori]
MQQVAEALNHPYFGVFVLLVFTFWVFNLTLRIQRFLSRKMAQKKDEKLKLAPYECGPVALKQPNRVSHHFYIMAMLFILFDVEIVFMFPWAIDFKKLGLFGLIEMLGFVFFLTIGFIYALKRNALSWQKLEVK